jgi:hypothetical protein
VLLLNQVEIVKVFRFVVVAGVLVNYHELPELNLTLLVGFAATTGQSPAF